MSQHMNDKKSPVTRRSDCTKCASCEVGRKSASPRNRGRAAVADGMGMGSEWYTVARWQLIISFCLHWHRSGEHQYCALPTCNPSNDISGFCKCGPTWEDVGESHLRKGITSKPGFEGCSFPYQGVVCFSPWCPVLSFIVWDVLFFSDSRKAKPSLSKEDCLWRQRT